MSKMAKVRSCKCNVNITIYNMFWYEEQESQDQCKKTNTSYEWIQEIILVK